jgi:hypothetical protein
MPFEKRFLLLLGQWPRSAGLELAEFEATHPNPNESDHGMPQRSHCAANLPLLPFDQDQRELCGLGPGVEACRAHLGGGRDAVLQLDAPRKLPKARRPNATANRDPVLALGAERGMQQGMGEWPIVGEEDQPLRL